jgi:hypothetical protein
MAYIQHRTLLKKFKQQNAKIIAYLEPCQELLENSYRHEVIISYMFSRIEIAHREALYFGVVKLHDVDSTLAAQAIDNYDLTRKDFRDKLESIYGYSLTDELKGKIINAEKIRDKILHGKRIKAGETAYAILDAVEYLAGIDQLLKTKSNILLIGDRRGFKGAKSSHSKATSRWILKGMGLLK